MLSFNCNHCVTNEQEKQMLERTISASILGASLLTMAPAVAATASAHPHWGAGHYGAHYEYVRPHRDRNYVGWSYAHHSSGRRVYFGPSYTYDSRRGIVDEACNLPSSACPNTQRDGQ
jgi:hypothetical protein